MTLVDEAILRQWVINSRRRAIIALPHLLCELHLRMKAVGLVTANQLELPLTQEKLADATGMTPVHVNRTIQSLRKAGLIEMGQMTLTIPDVDALARAVISTIAIYTCVRTEKRRAVHTPVRLEQKPSERALVRLSCLSGPTVFINLLPPKGLSIEAEEIRANGLCVVSIRGFVDLVRGDGNRVLERERVDHFSSIVCRIDTKSQIDYAVMYVTAYEVSRRMQDATTYGRQVGKLFAVRINQLTRAISEVHEIARHRDSPT